MLCLYKSGAEHYNKISILSYKTNRTSRADTLAIFHKTE